MFERCRELEFLRGYGSGWLDRDIGYEERSWPLIWYWSGSVSETARACWAAYLSLDAEF